MSKPLHPDALFRLMVLGPLASRGELKRGEISTIIRELAGVLRKRDVFIKYNSRYIE